MAEIKDKLISMESAKLIFDTLSEKIDKKSGEGTNGKSAYEYAKDGGYTGTEEEFTKKIAMETGCVTDSGGFQGGKDATATFGGAVGHSATVTFGGAVGDLASATYGGAVGSDSSATTGFSGGYHAKSSVDSIQLGTGTNSAERTMQAYTYRIMNENGTFPLARYAKYVSGKTITLDTGALYANLDVTEISGKGNAIIIPVLVNDTFGLVATVKCNSDKYYIHVTRSPELSTGKFTNIGIDYWILSETAL